MSEDLRSVLEIMSDEDIKKELEARKLERKLPKLQLNRSKINP
jgi:hypothetical protein